MSFKTKRRVRSHELVLWDAKTCAEQVAAAKKVVQGEPEWFQFRDLCRITTSKWGNIHGVSPFDGPVDVYNRLKGLTKFGGNIACAYGSMHEDVAIAAYVQALNVEDEEHPFHVQDTGLWMNTNYTHEDNFIYPPGPDPWVEQLRREFLTVRIGGSPDGHVFQNGCKIRVIEVKCPSSKLKPIPISKTPHYMYQCQGNMLFTETTECDFIVWTPYGWRCWRIPLVSTMGLTVDDLIDHEVILNEPELRDLERKGLYKDNRLVGYRRILMHVLFEFHKECIRSDVRTEKDWKRWLFQTSKERRWLNRVHEIAMERAVLVHREQRPLEVPFNKINWPAMLSWQLRALEEHNFVNETWGRFAVIGNGDKLLMDDKEYPAKLVHAKTLFPDAIMPISREGRFVYMDLFHPNKRNTKLLVRPLEFDANKQDHEVWYTKYHRKKELPLRGYYSLTVQEGTALTVAEVGEWNPSYHEGQYQMNFACGQTLFFTHTVLHAFSRTMDKKRRPNNAMNDTMNKRPKSDRDTT